MEFEVSDSDGHCVRVETGDWMTALIRGTEALGSVPTEFSCLRESPQRVRVEDRRSDQSWLVRALAVDPDPPETWSSRHLPREPAPSDGHLMAPSSRTWHSVLPRALWSPEGTPRRDRDDGAGQGSRPVNLSDALLERAAEIRNAKGAVEAAEICLRLAAAWADAEAGSVLLVDGDDRLVFWAVQGGAGDVLLGQPVPRGSGLAWAAAEGGVTLFVQDVAVDPRHYAGTDRETGFHTESLLAIPLRTDAHLYGVLELINARNTGGFLPWQIDAVESLAVSLTETLEGEA